MPKGGAECIHLLENPIRAYAWGSRAALAEIQGRPAPSAEPEAELWVRAHPLAASRVILDGELVVDNWTRQERGDSYYGVGSTEVTAQVGLVAGQQVEVEVEFAKQGPVPLAGLAADRVLEIAGGEDPGR